MLIKSLLGFLLSYCVDYFCSEIKSVDRSSHRRCSVKKGILRNFTKFTGKYLCQSLFFNKVAGLSPATLLKKRLWHRCFRVNFARFTRTPFLTEHPWWLLLYLLKKLVFIKAADNCAANSRNSETTYIILRIIICNKYPHGYFY